MKEIIEKKTQLFYFILQYGTVQLENRERPEGEKIESGLILSVFPPMLICRFSGTPGSAA